MPDKTEKTDEETQREAYAEALRREREGYVLRGLDDRVKAVDAELRRLGGTIPAAAMPEERVAAEPMEMAVESKSRRTASQRGSKAS